MATDELTIRITPEELAQRSDAVQFELVAGVLQERSMGSRSSEVAAKIIFLLMAFLEESPQGKCYGPDLGYRCFPDDPDKVRKPDVSFIQHQRLSEKTVDVGYMPIPPDLAIEVTSPGELTYTIDEKIEDYLHSGCRLVWVVNPKLELVDVYHPDGSNQRLHATETLTGENVLPGFECSVSKLFTTPDA